MISSTSKFLRLLNKSSNLYNYSHQKLTISAIHRICLNRMATNVYVSQRNEKENFQDVLPTVIDSLTSSPVFTEVPEVASWIKKVLEFNLAGGKKNRGLTTVIAYEMLERPENITEESLRLARIMGWCVEMLQAYFLVADDIMDGSSTRRGVPCWYRRPEVGLGAINDCILIYSGMFHILKMHFIHLPQYADILDLFTETILYTSSGQHLDYTMAHRSKDDYSLFTIERYDAIVKYKTAYYSYKLPVCLGLCLANRTDEHTHRRAEEISLEIGKLFQMQDDFIDCYSEESVSGKAGTDIKEGKCSWLAVVALQRCNPAQRAIFEQCYGSSDPEKIQRIKQLYDELELRRIYEEWERAKYEDIGAKTQTLSRETSLSPKLFLKLVDMIYNRKK